MAAEAASRWCPPGAEGAPQGLFTCYQGADLTRGPILTTSSRHSHFPKAPPPDTITLGGVFDIGIAGGGDTNIQPTAGAVLSTPGWKRP